MMKYFQVSAPNTAQELASQHNSKQGRGSSLGAYVLGMDFLILTWRKFQVTFENPAELRRTAKAMFIRNFRNALEAVGILS